MNEKKLRVAVIGQGRSGRDIHGAFFLSAENTVCEVAAIVESDPERRVRAVREFGCDVYSEVSALYGRKDIDLVVNATYSDEHYPLAKQLLEHGFHVLNEKPFAATERECRDLAETAEKHGVVVTAFHQTLFAPMFLKIREIIESGKLGDLLQISLRYSGFARRWDWQTLQSRLAGSVYNTGPHPIGMALALLDWDARTEVAFSDLRTVLTSGDAEDYGKLILTCPGKPNIDIEISPADAYASDYVFKICGSCGTFTATHTDYRMKYTDIAALPARPVVFESLKHEDGTPAYCSEHIPMTEETGSVTGSAFNSAVKVFYTKLRDSLFCGAPLAVTPQMATAVIRVIEKCHERTPLAVRFGKEGLL